MKRGSSATFWKSESPRARKRFCEFEADGFAQVVDAVDRVVSHAGQEGQTVEGVVSVAVCGEDLFEMFAGVLEVASIEQGRWRSRTVLRAIRIWQNSCSDG